MVQKFVISTFIITLALCLGFQASAEPVMVNRGEGQGLVFTFRGNCFLILPRHVHKKSKRVSIRSSAPAAVGNARIMSVTSNHDLSIGYVERGFERQCTQKWEGFPDSIEQILKSQTTGDLVRIASSGLLERVGMKIVSYDLDTMEAVTNKGGEFYQGTSGAFLEVGGTTIGMATDATSEHKATFLRMDEIKNELRRVLTSQANQNIIFEKPGSNTTQKCSKSKIVLLSVTCSSEPVDLQKSCNDLAKGNEVSFPQSALPLTIVAEISGDLPPPIHSIEMSSPLKNENTTNVKSVILKVDSSSGIGRRWRHFASGDAPPFGKAVWQNGTAPYAKRVRIDINSAWSKTMPVSLGCLSVR